MAIQDSLEIWILRFGLRFRFPILGKKEAVEFRTIITLIPKKEISVHAYIITLRVLFQCSFPTELNNDIQDRFTAKRQIDNVKACSFFYFRSVPFQLFQSRKCFIDVFEILSSFIVTHNKCIIINVTPSVCVTFAFICFPDTFLPRNC